jgi:hypothetical protein
VYLIAPALLYLIVDPLLFDIEIPPWRTRAWSGIKHSWQDLLIIGITVLVIAGGIVGLLLLPGQG